MDDVTALRDALRTRIDMGANWVEEYRALDGDEERDEGYRQLDALVAAVEARAAITPERLAKALVATTIFAGHAHDCPVWTNRMGELRGEKVDLDTCACWVKDEAPHRARRILAALATDEAVP